MAERTRLVLRIDVRGLDRDGQDELVAEIRGILATLPGDPRPALEVLRAGTEAVAAAGAEEPEK